MFMHIREPQEIEKAVKEFGAKAILVTNDKVETIKSNHADSNVFNYGYDFIIDNSGTLEELKEMAMVFCENEVLL